MEVEIRLREGQEEALGGELEAALPSCEAHVAPDEGIDFRRLYHLERGARVRDARLERRETLGRRGHIGREDASTHALDRTERVYRRLFHLIGKGQHVLGQARLDDVR